MALPCVSDTCSMQASVDIVTGALILDARLSPVGGLECVGDGTGVNDGISVVRFFDNTAVNPATATAMSDGLIPLEITTDGQLYSEIPSTLARSFPPGVLRDINEGEESNPSATINYTNNTNVSQLVDFRCAQPQIRVITTSDDPDDITNLEGFVALRSNLVNINGSLNVFQRDDKLFGPHETGNIIIRYTQIGSAYIVAPGQNLRLEISFVAGIISNLETAIDPNGFLAQGNYMIIHRVGEVI